MIEQDAVLLARCELFEGLPFEERKRVAQLCRRRLYRAREVVFHQGEIGREMYIVVSGRLKVSAVSEDGKELSFFILQESDLFGELALIDGETRSVSVTAVDSCELLMLRQADFQALLKQNDLIGLRLLSLLAGKVRSTTSLYESSVFIEIPGRLAGKLLELAEESGVESDGGVLIDTRLSQYDLGTLINASRESVNKQLKAWEAGGIIELRKGRICIREPDLLEALL
jgi:CRP/FNR family transcriptional regulator/CRP/FNR family cyclic AMP-dependent transcriptional regulator